MGWEGRRWVLDGTRLSGIEWDGFLHGVISRDNKARAFVVLFVKDADSSRLVFVSVKPTKAGQGLSALVIYWIAKHRWHCL